MKKILLGVLLFLTACDGAGLYNFGDRQLDRNTIVVEKVELANYKELAKEAAKHNIRVEPGRELFGFGFVNKVDPKCTIYFVKPEASTDPERQIGHEVMHCFYGEYHK